MKSYRKELWFNVPSRRGFVNITPDVEVALRESGIREGLVLINHNPITASRNHQLKKGSGSITIAQVDLATLACVVSFARTYCFTLA